MQDLTGCAVHYYITRGADRKPLESGFVKRHSQEHGQVSVKWTKSFRAVPHWWTYSEKEVRHFYRAGLLEFYRGSDKVELDLS